MPCENRNGDFPRLTDWRAVADEMPTQHTKKHIEKHT
jgi:hypothetical protein